MLEQIKDQYQNLTGNQKSIAKYILENYEMVAALSAAEFAKEVGVSDATIVRFAQSMGFRGFLELKNYIKQGMKNFAAPYHRSLNETEIHAQDDLLLRVGRQDLAGLEKLLFSYDEQKIEAAASEIYEADTIYFIGRGAAVCLQEFLILHLRRMGFKTQEISVGGAFNPEKLMGIKQGDLLIAICFPIYTKNTYQTMKVARQQGAKVLSITDSETSAIAAGSDVVLAIQNDSVTFFNSYVVPMAMCNMLLMKLFKRAPLKIQQSIQANMKKMENFDMAL